MKGHLRVLWMSNILILKGPGQHQCSALFSSLFPCYLEFLPNKKDATGLLNTVSSQPSASARNQIQVALQRLDCYLLRSLQPHFKLPLMTCKRKFETRMNAA